MEYFSNNTLDIIKTYRSFLIDIIENNDKLEIQHYIDIFKRIVSDAKLYRSSNSITIFNIDYKIYKIVIFLSEHDELIDSLDPNNLVVEDYRKILDVIDEHIKKVSEKPNEKIYTRSEVKKLLLNNTENFLKLKNEDDWNEWIDKFL